MHLRISQKFGKDREKQVDELTGKLNESTQQVCFWNFHICMNTYHLSLEINLTQKEKTTNQKLSDALKLIESLRLENESLTKQMSTSHNLNQLELNRLKQEISKIQDDVKKTPVF